MTERQVALKNYLVERLGFDIHDSFTEEYLEALEKVCRIHAWISFKEGDPEGGSDYPYYNFDEELSIYKPLKFDIVDFLWWENEYKKKSLFKKSENFSKFTSASDLANYSYCQVGYSISKTFEMPKNQLAIIGNELHEKQRLVSKRLNELFIGAVFDDDSNNFSQINLFLTYQSDEFVKIFSDDIKTSTLLYGGHNENNDKKYFINEELNFIGQPDYVFRSKYNKIFVVEEKYKKNNDWYDVYFQHHHKVQLAAYIYYLKKFKVDYGYLVYWMYDRDDPNVIVKSKVFIVKRSSEVKEYLFEVFKGLSDFRERKVYRLNPKEFLKPNKCAKCVYVLACGHKTGKFDQVTFPYQAYFQKLKYIPFPEELKKKSDLDDPNSNK